MRCSWVDDGQRCPATESSLRYFNPVLPLCPEHWELAAELAVQQPSQLQLLPPPTADYLLTQAPA